MLEKLAKQTAVYGISTIVVRFLSYLLTPYYTRVFGQETYGVVTDIYALIPLALTLLTMGMESSYFRFSAKAEEAGGDVKAAKRRLFATTWGVTSLAAAVFFLATAFFRDGIARMMGEAYVAHPEYVVWVGLIILFDVWACIPFSRLREQGRAMTFVGLKAMNVVLNVALAFGFGAAGLFATDFGVGWVFVANLIASVVTWLAILGTADRTVPKINWALLAAIFAYSLPLLVGGLAGTANEFIDRQLIKYLVPEGAMAQLGIYGAITKIAVVMMLFYQMYRLAAEPFFLSNFRKSDFVAMNAAALKYYVMASMLIFLGIALFRDVFALIVGRSFREGIFILPVVLGANVLTGVWLNLSFWYKREERTSLAIVVTGAGLVAIVAFGFWLIPLWGYYGAAWARLASETVMVAVSWWLNRRYYPTPYDWRRIGEYVAAALAVFAVCEALTASADNMFVSYAFNIVLFALYAAYLVRRERIGLGGHAKEEISLLRRDAGRVSHAQLFTGLSGSGALALAVAYVQYLCCRHRRDGDSCGECPDCKQIASLAHPDLHLVFPVNKQGKKSGEVMRSDEFLPLFRTLFDERGGYVSPQDWYDRLDLGKTLKGMIAAREADEIIRKLSFKSFEADYKTMLIWLPEAMNERPPTRSSKSSKSLGSGRAFILVSEQPDRLLPTIISRTQEAIAAHSSPTYWNVSRRERAFSDPLQARNMARLAGGDLLS